MKLSGSTTHHGELYCQHCSEFEIRNNASAVFQKGIAWDEFSWWCRQPNGLGKEGPNPGQKKTTRFGHFRLDGKKRWFVQVIILSQTIPQAGHEDISPQVRSSSGVSICTFVLVKQVTWVPSTRPRVGKLMRCFQHFHSMRCFSTNAWMPPQLLRCQYLYFCTSKASNLSTAAQAHPHPHPHLHPHPHPHPHPHSCRSFSVIAAQERKGERRTEQAAAIERATAAG